MWNEFWSLTVPFRNFIPIKRLGQAVKNTNRQPTDARQIAWKLFYFDLLISSTCSLGRLFKKSFNEKTKFQSSSFEKTLVNLHITDFELKKVLLPPP